MITAVYTGCGGAAYGKSDLKCLVGIGTKVQGSRYRFLIHTHIWIDEKYKNGSDCLRREPMDVYLRNTQV